MHTWCGFVFHPHAPTVKTLKEPLQSGHMASLSRSTGVGVGGRLGCVFFWLWKADIAERFDEGRTFRTISFCSTSAMTSFTGLFRIAVAPSTSFGISGS